MMNQRNMWMKQLKGSSTTSSWAWTTSQPRWQPPPLTTWSGPQRLAPTSQTNMLHLSSSAAPFQSHKWCAQNNKSLVLSCVARFGNFLRIWLLYVKLWPKCWFGYLAILATFRNWFKPVEIGSKPISKQFWKFGYFLIYLSGNTGRVRYFYLTGNCYCQLAPYNNSFN